MKITFTNNSVFGINRKYGSFTLEIPGRSSGIVRDVPERHVTDVLSYLNRYHPAVAWAPVKAEPEPEGKTDDGGAEGPGEATVDDVGADTGAIAAVEPTAEPEPEPEPEPEATAEGTEGGDGPVDTSVRDASPEKPAEEPKAPGKKAKRGGNRA